MINGPLPPGSNYHEVIPINGVNEGDYAIVECEHDEVLVSFQHASTGSIHVLCYNYTGSPISNLPIKVLIIRKPTQ